MEASPRDKEKLKTLAKDVRTLAESSHLTEEQKKELTDLAVSIEQLPTTDAQDTKETAETQDAKTPPRPQKLKRPRPNPQLITAS